MGNALKRQRIDPGWAWTRKLNISQGVKVGDTIYSSGTVAFNGDGIVIGEGDASIEARQVFRNIDEILTTAGASMADVVKITSVLTNLAHHAEVGRARTEAFPCGVPASAVSASPALIKPEPLVEDEAIAVIGSGS